MTNNQTPLLPVDQPETNRTNKTHPILFTSLFALTCVSLSIFSYLHFSSPEPVQTVTLSRPKPKLPRPVVIMVSADGFRFGYQFKTSTPNIDRLFAEGTSADRGLIPVYPTITFPNHYSIVTGLYPAYHGIVHSKFVDPTDGDMFTKPRHEAKFWVGETLWETVASHGLPAAVYYWPGAEVKKGNWSCPPRFCPKYNNSEPLEERVDAVLSYFDLPENQIPVLTTLYLESPDEEGHQVGPDDPQITAAVDRVDAILGRLINGLENRRLLNEVTIIFVGDHGMVSTCEKKYIYIEDFSDWIKIPDSWVINASPVLMILPPPEVNSAEVVSKINQALGSGKVNNGVNLKVYLKEDLPARLHYSESGRITPIVGIVGEGYTVALRRGTETCEGDHGYDNALFSMRTMFVGRGPRFGRGVKVPSFENVEIYNVVASILGVSGAPNNGSSGFVHSVLTK
ncbi:Venom phosphodiesterase [Linum perenne]